MIVRDDTTRQMLVDLEREEGLLAQADEALGQALARYRMAAARYVAVRDSIAEYIGQSPYNNNVQHLWSEGPGDGTWGKYRFLDKEPGVAVAELLSNAEGPLSTVEILVSVRSQGLKEINGKPIDGRTINAVLMNMKGIKKDKDGKYHSPPALPF